MMFFQDIFFFSHFNMHIFIKTVDLNIKLLLTGTFGPFIVEDYIVFHKIPIISIEIRRIRLMLIKTTYICSCTSMADMANRFCFLIGLLPWKATTDKQAIFAK